MGVILPKACLGFLQSLLQVPLSFHQLLLHNIQHGSVLFAWRDEAGGGGFHVNEERVGRGLVGIVSGSLRQLLQTETRRAV